jgi:hypothetical protein
MVLCRRIPWSPFPSSRGPPDRVRAITILSYRNQALCYSWTVAYFSEPAMLFSSGDSPQSASSNLSGEGFDEVQPGESPFFVSEACHLPRRLVLWRNGIKHHGLMLCHTCAHAAQRQRVRFLPPNQRTTTPQPAAHRHSSSAVGVTKAVRHHHGDEWRGDGMLDRAPHSSSFFACPSIGP